MSRGITLPAITVPANLRTGAWSWFHQERSIIKDGILYMAYAAAGSAHTQTGIRTYDPSIKLTGEVLFHALSQDDHNLAGLCFTDQEKLVVGYSAHIGTTFYRRLALNANDALAWSAEQTQTGDTEYTYQSPFYMPNEGTGVGRIYMFYRGGPANGPSQRYIYSDDRGATWSAPVDWFVNGNKAYRITVQNGDRLHFVISKGHPVQDTGIACSLYHCYFEAGVWYKSDGTEISAVNLPFDETDLTPVIDTAGHDFWQWDIEIDGAGNPIILYVDLVDPATDQMFGIARWTGSAWTSEQIVQSGGYINGAESGRCGGGAIYDENTVYLSIKDGGGLFDLWRYTKSGGTWSGTKLTTSAGSTDRNVLPCCPLGANATIPVIWVRGNYLGFSNVQDCVYKIL